MLLTPLNEAHLHEPLQLPPRMLFQDQSPIDMHRPSERQRRRPSACKGQEGLLNPSARQTRIGCRRYPARPVARPMTRRPVCSKPSWHRRKPSPSPPPHTRLGKCTLPDHRQVDSERPESWKWTSGLVKSSRSSVAGILRSVASPEHCYRLARMSSVIELVMEQVFWEMHSDSMNMVVISDSKQGQRLQ